MDELAPAGTIFDRVAQRIITGSRANPNRPSLSSVPDADELEAQRRERLWGYAEVPTRFQDFTFDNFPGTVPDAVREGGSLLIWGPFGTGKTALAVSMVRDRVYRQGLAAQFITSPKLLDRIRATFSDRNGVDEADVLLRIKTIPFLVLDDLGAERVTEWVEEKLFTIINERHDEMLTTVFTTNLSPAQLGNHIGERTAWRVMEMCKVLKLDGVNLRAKSVSGVTQRGGAGSA